MAGQLRSPGSRSPRPDRVRRARAGVAARAVAALLLGGLLSACGPGGASFDGAVYRNGPLAFRVGELPPGWRRVEVEGASLSYRSDERAATILVNGRCHPPDEDTPLVALTNHLLIGSTAREIASQEVEPFDGREALRTRLRARWDGVPMSFDVYVMKKDGCVYDFVYMGDVAEGEAGSREFATFVSSFRTLPGSGMVKGR